MEIDWAGTVLQSGACASIILAISFGGVVFSWSSGQIIGLFICAGMLFGLFGLQQYFAFLITMARRVFPVQYLRRKEMVILFCQIAAGSSNSFLVIYFIPVYFQFAQNNAALTAGVRLLPYIVPLIVATMANGATMEKLRYYPPWFLVGGLLILGSNIMLTRITLASSFAYIYGALALGGLGTGLFVNAPFAIAQWLVPADELGEAVGFITLAQAAGCTISLAIANSVFLNLAQNGIAAVLPDLSIGAIQAAIAGVGGNVLRTLGPMQQAAVLDAIVFAIQRAFILGLTAGALTVVLSVFMSRKPINIGPN